MMRRRTSAADHPDLVVVIITMDRHIAGAVERARAQLEPEIPGLELRLHAASEWAESPKALERCRTDIARGHIVLANMLFIEDQVRAVLPALQARREECDAMVGFIAAGEVIKLTRLGGFSMDGEAKGPLALLKRLRGSKKSSGGAQAGEKQMAMLRRLPKILRFIPGTAQDVRAYFLTLQYWLAGSDDNIANMVRYLVKRYADGPRRIYRGAVDAKMPAHYPETGLYHPDLPRRVSEDLADLPRPSRPVGRVGVLVMRSYVLAGDARHYDGVIRSLEARGLEVVTAFAAGLDARGAIEKYFRKNGETTIDALVSLTGFSLVGGPAFNDAQAAREVLAELDVPYLSAQAIEFQTIEQWKGSSRGLLPVESTIMVAIPEIDGATNPLIYGGRSEAGDPEAPRAMLPIEDRVERLTERVEALVALRRARTPERRLAIVLFNFPPNGGATGTAAFLSVFASLHATLTRLAEEGYDVEVPETVDALRERVLGGNAERFGTDANVVATIPVDDHVRREPHLAEIESQWGPAPGRHQADGRSLFVLGARFGSVLVGIQPAFGYEGDPMRLLFEQGFSPTHAFSAFYRYVREDFGAHAVLHFGTHGALEFMPGRQVGLGEDCWPDRLIAGLPNFYLYAANNPSEGTIAKRRSAATLISYMTPPVGRSGLYTDLEALQASLTRWLSLPPGDPEAGRVRDVILEQAIELNLVSEEDGWAPADDEASIARLADQVREIETTLIPDSLHIIGQAPSRERQIEHLQAMSSVLGDSELDRDVVADIIDGASTDDVMGRLGPSPSSELRETVDALTRTAPLLAANAELDGLLGALDGGFVRPAPGGDPLRSPEVLPTGRNLHGFDPFRIPSRFALDDGRAQADRLLERHVRDGHDLPRSVAVVLWGTDNLKSEGGPIGQVLALIGAKPRFDGFGRLCGAELIPLETLGRPRIDVVVTLSGIFRDLLPLQTKLLAEATWLAAQADEAPEQNFIRAHALEYQAKHGCDLETAALRVFSNADGAYGSNVNQLIDSGAWESEDELADTYAQRKCFAYGRSGKPERSRELLNSVLSTVDLTYQNLESVELGVTTIDHYFDTLGGIGRAVKRARGSVEEVPVYIGDQTTGDGKVRTLAEQVNLESRTRMLNPKWYEGMLEHGSEGVRQIEAHITNTMGWSATTGQVAPWVYEQLSQTFVLDEEMRERLARLNPKASVKLVNRLIEAHERNYWRPNPEMLDQLREAGEQLEDRLEGLGGTVAA